VQFPPSPSQSCPPMNSYAYSGKQLRILRQDSYAPHYRTL
jgi:hypothetical protein